MLDSDCGPFNSLFVVVDVPSVSLAVLTATARRKWLPQLGDKNASHLSLHVLHVFDNKKKHNDNKKQTFFDI